MPDPYAAIAQTDPAVQDLLAGILELRAADPRQRDMLASYTAELALPAGSRVLEIGCGTGAVSRFHATLDNVASVVGVDPGERFIAKARAGRRRQARLQGGCGAELELEDGSFDAVVIHTVLCHAPARERIVAEAHRVLRPGGSVAAFDNDPTTATVAVHAGDPLQECVAAQPRGRRGPQGRGARAQRERPVLRVRYYISAIAARR